MMQRRIEEKLERIKNIILSEKMENNVLKEEEATKEYDDREEKYVEEFLYEGIWIKRRRVGT